MTNTTNHDGSPPTRGWLPTPSHSWDIARIDLKRGYRWALSQDFWLIFAVFMTGIGAFLLWLTYDTSTDLATTLAAGDPVPTWPITIAGVFWVFLTILLAGDAAGSNTDLDNDGQYLTIRPTPDIVGGMVIAAILKFGVYTLPVGLVAGYGLATTLGTPTPFVGMIAAAVILPMTAAAIGYPLGFTVKGILRRSKNLARLATIVGLLAAGTYVVLSVTGGLLAVITAIEPLLQTPPISWFGTLALATTPQESVDFLGPTVLLVGTPVIVGAGLYLAMPAARYAWLADGTTDDESDGVPAPPDTLLDPIIGHVTRRQPTRGLAMTILRRSVRSPTQFVFVAPPILALIALGEAAVTTGELPWFAPWFVVWYGAWAAGAVIPLNPLGNQGAALPTLLTASATGRDVVHAHVVAAILAAGPPTTVLAVGAGALADGSPTTLATLAAASVGAIAVSTILAVGIGTLYPRFDAVDFAGSSKAVPPSKRAYALYGVTMSVLVAALVLRTQDVARIIGTDFLTTWVPIDLTVDAGTLALLSSAIVLAGILTLVVAYRGAIRRIDTYHVA